jgi:hypothetical protein
MDIRNSKIALMVAAAMLASNGFAAGASDNSTADGSAGAVQSAEDAVEKPALSAAQKALLVGMGVAGALALDDDKKTSVVEGGGDGGGTEPPATTTTTTTTTTATSTTTATATATSTTTGT